MIKTAVSKQPNVALRMSDGVHDRPIRNIYAVGRNYAAHAQELGNEMPSEPVIFMKPTAALIHEPDAIYLPGDSKTIHFEAELVVLIGTLPTQITIDNALFAIEGFGLGLDLTDRAKQNDLKKQGLPWTLAKGFKGSAPISQFMPANEIRDLFSLNYTLTINHAIRQHADVSKMLFSIPTLIVYLHEHIGLQTGDLIFTGTPEGVGALCQDDQLCLTFDHYPLQATFSVKIPHAISI